MEASIYVQAQIKEYDRKYAGVGFIYERVACGICGQNVGHNEQCKDCGNHIIVKVDKSWRRD